MLRKSFVLAIAVLLLHVGVKPAFAASQQPDQAKRIAKVKADVAKRGVGEKAAIRLKLRDNREVKGYVYRAGEDDFVVADSKTGAQSTIAYADVSQVKGKGLSKAAKIGIGVGIGLVVIGIVIAVAAHSIGDSF